MKLVKISLAAALVCGAFVGAFGADEKPKRTLQGNMNEVYNTLPASVDTIGEAFSKGEFYGRLRANIFKWDIKADDSTTSADNKAFGLGGSMIYKTAPLMGLSATAGFYYADSPFSGLRDANADAGLVKSGKDTFSRYDVKYGGDWYMAVLAQAYLQYNISKTDIVFGRQLFESVLTASNDTKMIPNAFEGLSVISKDIPKTTLKGAYFYAQKLRDHTTFHDVLTFKDATGESWGNNDDSGVHKGLSYANFTAKGKDTEHKLVVLAATNQSVPNLKLDATYTAVPGVVSSVIGEVNYKIGLNDTYSVSPGVRYMKQMDNGGGEVGGASLGGTVTAASTKGYKTGDSLDSSLWMARLVLSGGPLKVMGAYSATADEADIVAPWRGFPTGGYTRAMAQLNWTANAKTAMGEVVYDFGKAKMVDGFKVMARYALQDFDEDKQAAGGQADMGVVHIDLMQQFTKQLDAKIRVGLIGSEARVGSTDKDSYNEYRFELNYLF